jgi:hypothetical protein
VKLTSAFLSLALFSLLFLGLNDARSQNVCPEDGQVIAGHLDVNGPHQLGRVFRDGIPSSCPSKVYPGLFGPATQYSYQVFEFGTSLADNCVTVNFNPSPGTGNDCNTNAHASAYLNSYDPNNQAANYVGDVGSSITDSFSFVVPAGDRLLLVTTNTSGAATCDYVFSILNYDCGTIVSQIILAPETALLTSGEPHTVTATVLSNGQPAPGVLVSFRVTSGPNAGRESVPGSGECSVNDDCTTDSNGQVSWTYTSFTSGIDTVTASVESGEVTVLSNIVEVRWLGRPIPTLSEWGLIAMAGLAGLIGLYALRRKKAAAR